MNYFNGLSNPTDMASELISETFTENPSYVPVWRNFNFSKTYDTWLENGTVPNNTLGWKKLISYPYKPTVFDVGDFVIWNYDRELKSVWIMESFDKQIPFNATGR
ncbi:MAG: hypothetical protein RR313_12650, partial [Anaerovoracaceae bacterium]